MTFREAIQIQIKALQEIYDNAEGLRDVAANEEMNLLRSQLPTLWSALQRFDNKMGDQLAGYLLKGNYSVNVTKESI